MLKALADWIASGLSLTVGTDLLCGFRPATAQDFCTALQERVQSEVSVVTPDFEIKRVQIVTRGPIGDYWAASNRATLISEWLLSGQQINVTIPDPASGTSWTIHSVEGGNPGYLGEDEKRRHEFSANLTVRVRKES